MKPLSTKSFLEFLRAARDDAAVLDRYDSRDLAQLVFHARNDGFDFTTTDIEDVVGALEASTITVKDAEPLDATSTLWRHMWGTHHLRYVVDSAVRRHTDAELQSLVEGR